MGPSPASPPVNGEGSPPLNPFFPIFPLNVDLGWDRDTQDSIEVAEHGNKLREKTTKRGKKEEKPQNPPQRQHQKVLKLPLAPFFPQILLYFQDSRHSSSTPNPTQGGSSANEVINSGKLISTDITPYNFGGFPAVDLRQKTAKKGLGAKRDTGNLGICAPGGAPAN